MHQCFRNICDMEARRDARGMSTSRFRASDPAGWDRPAGAPASGAVRGLCGADSRVSGGMVFSACPRGCSPRSTCCQGTAIPGAHLFQPYFTTAPRAPGEDDLVALRDLGGKSASQSLPSPACGYAFAPAPWRASASSVGSVRFCSALQGRESRERDGEEL
jgi:hypothetical protein